MLEGARGAVERIMRRLGELAGSGPGNAVDRVVFSDAHVEARRQLVRWAADADLHPQVDPVGNLWLLPNASPTRTMLMGSHLDSVPNGGRFDGALGLLIALEIAATRRHERSIAVVDFIAEESSRFGVGTIGSSVFAGRRALEEAMALRDADGATFGLLRGPLWSEHAARAAPDPDRFSSYLEVHIDQATALTDLGAPVGIVDAIAAPTRWRVTCEGEQAHAGATPMSGRHDALAAAAEVVLQVEAIAREPRANEIRATVGRLDVRPNAVNVIPGAVAMTLELRALDVPSIDAFAERLQLALQGITDLRGVSVKLERLTLDTPRAMADEIVTACTKAAEELGVAAAVMPSWPAHDALHVSARMPAGMLFVRNEGGLSHNPAESVSLDDLEAVYSVAGRAVERLAPRTKEVNDR